MPQRNFFYPINGIRLKVHNLMISLIAVCLKIEESCEEEHLVKLKEDNENKYKVSKDMWETSSLWFLQQAGLPTKRHKEMVGMGGC